MTSSTTVTKNDLYGSYEYTLDFPNSLKVEAVIKEITIFHEPINMNLWQTKVSLFLSRHIPKSLDFPILEQEN